MKTVIEYQADIKADRARITEITAQLVKLTAKHTKMEKKWFAANLQESKKFAPKVKMLYAEILALKEERSKKELNIDKTGRLLHDALSEMDDGVSIGW